MMITKMYIKAMCAKEIIKNKISDQKGEVNVVAIVVLIGIAVLLAVIFKKQVSGLIDNLFKTIGTSANSAVSS